MKKISLKSIIIAMMVAFVCMSANAQRVVKVSDTQKQELSQTDFEALKAEKEVYKILITEKNDGTIHRDSIVRKVVDGEVYEWTYRSTYRKTTTAQLTIEELEQINKGELSVTNLDHKDLDGNFRHKVVTSILAGASYIGDNLAPVVTGRLGYETCHWLFELEGSYSRAEYAPNASAYGRKYNTFIATGNVGWKFLQDRRYRSYIAVLATAGYGMQKSDKRDAEFFSKNFGFVYGGMIRGSWGLTNRLRLIGEVGYKMLPEVEHEGGTQEFDHGLFANVGVGMTF